MPYDKVCSYSIAVIGAGISGLFTAKILGDRGISVQVYEKSRGTGGRIATRRIGDLAFDIGAQYFTTFDDRFRNHVDLWINNGIVQKWEGRIIKINLQEKQIESSNRYVGCPHMTAMTRHLAHNLKITFNTRVNCIRHKDSAWQLTNEKGEELGLHKVVIVATPPLQAVPLLAEAPHLAAEANSIVCHSCWTVMVSFNHQLPLQFDGAFINSPTLAWAARNSSKPYRSETESWVIHASAEWSENHIEDPAPIVAEELLKDFFLSANTIAHEPIFLKAHRWRYAKAQNPLTVGSLWDPVLRIGACGDWCTDSRVEGAALSGMDVACRVLGRMD